MVDMEPIAQMLSLKVKSMSKRTTPITTANIQTQTPSQLQDHNMDPLKKMTNQVTTKKRKMRKMRALAMRAMKNKEMVQNWKSGMPISLSNKLATQ